MPIPTLGERETDPVSRIDPSIEASVTVGETEFERQCRDCPAKLKHSPQNINRIEVYCAVLNAHVAGERKETQSRVDEVLAQKGNFRCAPIRVQERAAGQRE